MRKTILTLLAAVPVFTALVLTTGAGVAQAEIAWETKLRKAHDRASQEGKLLLLHFTRDNCVYCDKLEEGAFTTDTVSSAVAANFVPVKVNVSDSRGNKKLGEMFKVDRFPMDVVVTTDGKALVHSVSPQDPQLYVAMLNKTLTNPTPLQRPGTPERRPATTNRSGTCNSLAGTSCSCSSSTGTRTANQRSPKQQLGDCQPQTPNQRVAANTVSNRSGEMSLSMPVQSSVAKPSIAPPSIAPPSVIPPAAPSRKSPLAGRSQPQAHRNSRWTAFVPSP